MRSRIAAAAGAIAFVVAACGGGGATSAPAGSDQASTGSAATPAASATGAIKIWGHQGQENEVAATKKAVADFNAANTGVTAEITFIPEADYATKISTTACQELPDVFEVGGENVAENVYNKKLAALDGVVAQATLDNQISSTVAQGTVDGKRYSVSQYDSGLAMYGNKSMLAAAGVDIPATWKDAWTADEFDQVLQKLAAKSTGGKAIDLKENYAGQWPGYAFLPVVNSTGYLAVKGGKADGNLNAPAVAASLARFAAWKQYVDANADDKAFASKRVGLAWVGHWVYTALKEALGDDLVLIPLPDFGKGTKSGQGSLAWGISACSGNPAAGAKFLEFLVADAQVKQITDSNAAPPGTKTGTAASSLYAPGGPLQLYADQLAASCGGGDVELTPECVDVPRTISPAWPVINTQFSKAFWNIYNGADAQTELTNAAKAIDQDSADNGGYQP